MRSSLILIFPFAFLLGASPARAQDLSGCHFVTSQLADKEVVVEKTGSEETVSTLIGSPTAPVQVDCDNNMQFFADRMKVYSTQTRVVGEGHVLFKSGDSQIYAEKTDFNTKTRTGTFYDAAGTASLGNRVDRSFFGDQDPDAYFWGEEIHKLGPKKYRIKRGGFTTCLQPTPRWVMTSGSVTLTLEEHAVLTNTLLWVKGVPLMYLPVFYFPIQSDNRATGFLPPVYGTSNVQGQTFRNTFFLALGRSQDVTLYHDWFTKTGQGFSSDYRYALKGGQGTMKLGLIKEHATTYTTASGTTGTSPARNSYQVTGSMSQALPFHLHGRASADYFSSITTQQRYQQNVFRATSRTSRFGGNVSGNWREYNLSGTFEQADVFNGTTSFIRTGSLPRVTFNRSERPIGKSPLYFGVNTEYATLLRSTTENGVRKTDNGLTRMDVLPVLRYPFTRWPFLTLNSSLSWRGTYWTESLDENRQQVPEPVGRRYFSFQTRITGPVFNRIFNTPNWGYAQKFKHVIEPTLTISRTTAIDNVGRIVQLESPDYVVGSATSYAYGVSNRLYGKAQSSREILDVSVTQSYYTNAQMSAVDRQYQSSFSGTKPTHFSPVAMTIHASPNDNLQGDFRTEWDPTKHALRTLAANGTYSGQRVQITGGWSQRRYIPGLSGFDDPKRADQYLNTATTVRFLNNKVGASYSFNYDLLHDRFLQQMYTATYNAQCCGVAVNFQSFNFQSGFAGLAIPRDNRFNVSFTLAGLGTFANFFGALTGQQDRR